MVSNALNQNFGGKTGSKFDSSILPNSIEAEQAVIGAIIVDPDAFSRVIDVIDSSEYFYKSQHQEIFSALMTLTEKSENIDLVTIAQILKDKDLLEKIGGVEYLDSLTERAPIAANAPYYAKIIKSKSLLRNMILAGNEIVELGHNTHEDLDSLVDKAEQIIFNLSQSKSKNQLTHIGDLVHQSWKILEEREANKGQLSGVNTGFFDLNTLTSGFQKSDLIILAARPAMGKTSFALNLAENVALKAKRPVAVFSLEMSKEQLVQRLLCARAEVDSSRVRTGQLHSEDWEKLGEAMAELGEAPIYIDDSAGVTVMELRGKCRRLQAQCGGDLGLIVIDYLQLIEGRSNDNRINQISEISRGLKLIAREINVPVLALSQLSRAVEARQDKRPMLSDLRESGSIEQDADIVMFIYRDDYYNDESEKPGIADIIIAKQRSGPTGQIELLFQNNITKFKNPLQ
jgi:replicative DNA helicase